MSPTSGHKPAGRGSRGFTLVEVLVAVSLSAIVFAGILSAFLFMGRNLTRLINLQTQEVASRRAVRQFTQDLSAAIRLTSSSSTQVALTKPAASGTAAVSYVYTAGAGTFVRTDSTGSQTLLSGLTALTITYYNEGGTAISDSPQSVKAVELAFTTTTGSEPSGTKVAYSTVAPRVLLRNKPLLE
ncbi:MAG: prepilin-type N-terminal cleavage/methylation domain-containing protein [Verrucomicrobia bacterium]|nr:prepilin-type N-terminal cleavage/methylation domain-containing protein [Verrucomicrobiota bacterium]